MEYVIDSRNIVKTTNIVIYGAQDWYIKNYNMLLDFIKPKYIYPNGSLVNRGDEGLIVLKSVEDIKKIENPFVLIAIGNESGIKFASDILKKNRILFDHMGNYLASHTLSLKYLLYMNTYKYIDVLGNYYEIDVKTSPNINIYRREGLCYNNKVYLKNLLVSKELKISLWGHDAIIDFQNGSVVEAKIEITTNGSVVFGNDCMVSFDVFIGQADQHHIFDMCTGKRINNCKGIYVGNHVWLGKGCELFDGTHIEDGSIVASCAITSHHFDEKNIIIAGVPGKIIRKNIIWARDEQGYNYQMIEECSDKNGLKYK